MEFFRKIFFPKAESSDEDPSEEEEQKEDIRMEVDDDSYGDSPTEDDVESFKNQYLNRVPANPRYENTLFQSQEKPVDCIEIEECNTKILAYKNVWKYLDEEIFTLKKQTCRLDDQKRELNQKLKDTLIEEEKMKLRIKMEEEEEEKKEKEELTEKEIEVREVMLREVGEMVEEEGDLQKEIIQRVFDEYALSKRKIQFLKGTQTSQNSLPSFRSNSHYTPEK